MRILIAIFAGLSTAALATTEQKVPGANPLASASSEFLAGRFEPALAKLAAAEGQGVPEAAALSLRGSIHFEQGKLEEALADFRAAHEKDSSLLAPRLRIGDALLRQKKWEEARTVYAEILKDTNLVISSERLRYAILLTHLGAKDDTGAKTALEQVTFPTESPAYYYAQAAWEFAHGSDRTAAKWIKTAAGIFNDTQTAWFARPLYDLGWIKIKPSIVLL